MAYIALQREMLSFPPVVHTLDVYSRWEHTSGLCIADPFKFCSASRSWISESVIYQNSDLSLTHLSPFIKTSQRETFQSLAVTMLSGRPLDDNALTRSKVISQNQNVQLSSLVCQNVKRILRNVFFSPLFLCGVFLRHCCLLRHFYIIVVFYIVVH